MIPWHKISKFCLTCEEEKFLEDFVRDKRKRDGYTTQCKTCRYSHNRKYYANHKEPIIERVIETRRTRKEHPGEPAPQKRNTVKEPIAKTKGLSLLLQISAKQRQELEKLLDQIKLPITADNIRKLAAAIALNALDQKLQSGDQALTNFIQSLTEKEPGR